MPYIGYIIILLVCAGITLAALSRINQKWYPHLLFGMALAMVLITSLSPQNTVLADTHLEYYYARVHAGEWTWEPKYHIPQETTIGSIYIAPFLSDVLHIPLIWIFKVVYPILLALVPVILYSIYRKWFTPREAFLASVLFIAFPAFLMELPTITRQILAEVVLAVLLWLVIRSELRYRYKIPLLAIGGVLLSPLHYATGFVTIVILACCLTASWVLKQRKYFIPIGVILLSLILTSSIYFSFRSGGAIPYKIGTAYNQFAPSWVEMSLTPPEEPKPLPDRPDDWGDLPLIPDKPIRDYFGNVMQAGLGFDFIETDGLGKIFRALQWLILAIIVAGLWRLRRNRTYWVFASGFLLVSALCIVPGWAGFLNATRFVHFSLFLLAPAFVIGAKWLFNKEWMPILILVPYFLYTSGFVFEATKQPDVERLTIPYSVGLTDHRMDLGATFTDDDTKVREHIVNNNLFPLYSDVFGSYFMQDIVGSRGDLNEAFDAYLNTPTEGYIYIRDRNIEDETLTIWFGVGCRRFASMEEFGIDPDKNIVFQSGNARVLEVQ